MARVVVSVRWCAAALLSLSAGLRLWLALLRHRGAGALEAGAPSRGFAGASPPPPPRGEGGSLGHYFRRRPEAAPCAVLRHTFKLAPECGEEGDNNTVELFGLLVTGTGRTATAFVATELRRRGYAFVHDNTAVGRGGAASWPLAIRETELFDRRIFNTSGYALPGFAAVQACFRRADARARFRLVFHQVRDPLKTIVSRAARVGMMYAPIVYSNPHLFRDALGFAPSFPPAKDLDLWYHDRAIAAWSTEKRLRVALFHYVFWNEWVGAYADARYRIEDVVDVEQIAHEAGLAHPRTTTPPRDKHGDHDRRLGRASQRNNRSNHFAIPPELAAVGWPELCRTSAFMCGRAKRLARLYGYDVPS